jgi:hypothetical protein
MAAQRILMAIAVLAALALVLIIPRVFAESAPVQVPPVELRTPSPAESESACSRTARALAAGARVTAARRDARARSAAARDHPGAGAAALVGRR